MKNGFLKLLISLFLIFNLSCSSPSLLKDLGNRLQEQKYSKREIRVDVSSRHVGEISRLGWAGFSVSIRCTGKCQFSDSHLKLLADELSNQAFFSFDASIREALSASLTQKRTLVDAAFVIQDSEYVKATELDSYQSRMGKWLKKLGISQRTQLTSTPKGMKAIDPSEIGWSGEEYLQKLAGRLALDGLLVGRMEVVVDEDANLNVVGPKVWLFSATRPKVVAVAGLKSEWLVQPSGQNVDWTGLKVVASAFGNRFAEAFSEK